MGDGHDVSARTVTPHLLSAQSRWHEASLRVFCDSDDWTAIPWPAIAGDPEWLDHQSAMDACAAVSARLFSEALGLDQWVFRELQEVYAARARTVTPQAVSVMAHLHEVICGGRWAGERELARPAGAGRGTVRRILTVLRRGGRIPSSAWVVLIIVSLSGWVWGPSDRTRRGGSRGRCSGCRSRMATVASPSVMDGSHRFPGLEGR